MKLNFYIILILFSFFAFSQSKELNSDDILFDDLIKKEDYILDSSNENAPLSTSDLQKVNELEKNILTDYEFFITKFPTSEHLAEVLFHKGNTEWSLNNTIKAKESLILFVNLEKENTFNKNRAYKLLATIAIEQKAFKQAILYLKKQEEIKLFYGCGNFFETDKVQLKNMYEICRKGLVEQEKTKN